jgi:DNA-directed RNA polymerase subunit beta
METSDYGEVDLRSIIEGDRHFGKDDESFGEYGFSKQEFEGEELIDVTEEDEEDDEDEFLDFDADFEEE